MRERIADNPQRPHPKLWTAVKRLFSAIRSERSHAVAVAAHLGKRESEPHRELARLVLHRIRAWIARRELRDELVERVHIALRLQRVQRRKACPVFCG